MIVSARNTEHLRGVADALAIPREHQVVLDFTAPEPSTILASVRALPPLSCVIHCASMYNGSLSGSTDTQLREWGYFYSNTLAMVKAALERMNPEGGRIILIGSVVGSPARISINSPYAIFKGWLRLLAEAITVDGHNHRISGTYVNLGSFRDDEVAARTPGQFAPMSAVVAEVTRLAFLDPCIRVERTDLIPIDEMLT